MLSPLPRWNLRNHFALTSGSGGLPRYYGGSASTTTFRGLLGVHFTLQPAIGFAGPLFTDLFWEYFSSFVTSWTAPSASGWSDVARRGFTRTTKTPLQGVHNNLVENAIRPTAVGKKNWLFIGEANAGHRSAVIYTLIEACRRRSIDPYEYLRDVLTRLPSATTAQIKDLTPQAWAQGRRATSLRSVA